MWGIIILFARLRILGRGAYNAPVYYPENTTVQIEKGDTINKFFPEQGFLKRIMLKFRLRNHRESIPMLQEGNYLLSGKYTKAELMNLIKEWPQRDVKRVTLLEWRSMI